jgi:hypothetical protein
VKKGRHRRFEEARALKQLSTEGVEGVLTAPTPASTEPCAECGAEPGADHASWCLATEDEETEEDEA